MDLVGHHAQELGLAQHEFDQLIAGGEEAEEMPSLPARHDAGGIAGQIVQHDPRLAGPGQGTSTRWRQASETAMPSGVGQTPKG